MRKIASLLVFLGTAFTAPTAFAEITAAERAANAEAMELGKLIYRYDQAAWHSTDALMAAIKVADYPDLRGWVVEPYDDDTLLVTYFGQRDGPRYAVLRYIVRDSTVVEGGLVPAGADASLSALANRMIDARDAANEQFGKERLGLCTEGNANSVILPPDEGGLIRAYIMSASTTAGVFPLGGHYRFTVGPNGKVQSWRPYLKGCLAIDSRPKPDAPKPAFFVVSHLLDPQPTEMHYFVRYNVPLDMGIVMQDGDIWMLGTAGFTNPKGKEIGLP